MFSIGDYVVSGNKGVCTIEEIRKLDISGADSNEDYYILKPIYNTSSTVYIPFSMAETSMRHVLSKEEADSLVDDIPNIPELEVTNERQLENEYKTLIRSGDVREWVKLLKTIYARKQVRFQAGRKETALDARYFHMAEEFLYGELAVSLKLDKKSIEDYISQHGWGDRFATNVE